MKIVSSVAAVYQEQALICTRLRAEVDTLIKRDKKSTWHYISRIKELESFALKLETGRCDNPREVEDFFACMLVVENHRQIKIAYDIVENLFEIKTRRPKDDGVTHKSPDSFPFDDLRLYCSLRPDERLPKTQLNDLVFELQIKTFLQHAWSIATHDVIYKSDEISWSRERVAFQTKAILEQVEMSISGIETLILLPEIAKTNYEIRDLTYIKSQVTSRWSKSELPKDVIRLVKNIFALAKEYGLSIRDIFSGLDRETTIGKGTKTKDLSPFNIICQSIVNQNTGGITSKLSEAIAGGYRPKFKLFIPKELDVTKITGLEEKRTVSIPEPKKPRQ